MIVKTQQSTSYPSKKVRMGILFPLDDGTPSLVGTNWEESADVTEDTTTVVYEDDLILSVPLSHSQEQNPR